jgi:CheY-like chemotaxis protein
MTLIGDENRYETIIMCLLSNAVKFTPEQGAIQLIASVRETENESITLQVEVVDNGIGIPEEQQEEIFAPFVQADGGIDRKFSGAGLGLSIAKRFIELMDGAIWVESEPDKGSRFVFTTKLQVKEPEAAGSGPVFYEGMTALLADDVEINRDIVMALLEDTGLKFVCAENGQEAVDHFTADPEGFHIIFMDINMPVMDGVEATRQIRAYESTVGFNTPIIAITANVLMNEVETYYAAGMTDHIGKPVDYDILIEKMKKHVKQVRS